MKCLHCNTKLVKNIAGNTIHLNCFICSNNPKMSNFDQSIILWNSNPIRISSVGIYIPNMNYFVDFYFPRTIKREIEISICKVSQVTYNRYTTIFPFTKYNFPFKYDLGYLEKITKLMLTFN